MTAGRSVQSDPNRSCFPSESGNEISARRLLKDVGIRRLSGHPTFLSIASAIPKWHTHFLLKWSSRGTKMANTVVCLTQDRAQAEQIIAALRDGNFPNTGISVVLPDVAPSQTLQPVEDNKSAEGAAIGAGTGGVIGGVLGWLVGIGMLTLPGIGPLLAAGPILAALSGAAVGGAVGGVAGGLTGLGFTEDEVNRYLGRIKEGHAMVAVHSDDPAELERARDLFARNGGEIVTPDVSPREREAA
jgi:hypothetical protein